MLIIQLLLESISSKDDCQVINSFRFIETRAGVARNNATRESIRWRQDHNSLRSRKPARFTAPAVRGGCLRQIAHKTMLVTPT